MDLTNCVQFKTLAVPYKYSSFTSSPEQPDLREDRPPGDIDEPLAADNAAEEVYPEGGGAVLHGGGGGGGGAASRGGGESEGGVRVAGARVQGEQVALKRKKKRILSCSRFFYMHSSNSSYFSHGEVAGPDLQILLVFFPLFFLVLVPLDQRPVKGAWIGSHEDS